MKLTEVLKILSDGHTIISVEKAKEICQTVNVSFDRNYLVRKFKSDPVGTHKGLTMEPEYENADGVDTLTLSSYVAKELGVINKAGSYIGRGFQARAYADVIAEKLKVK